MLDGGFGACYEKGENLPHYMKEKGEGVVIKMEELFNEKSFNQYIFTMN